MEDREKEGQKGQRSGALARPGTEAVCREGEAQILIAFQPQHLCSALQSNPCTYVPGTVLKTIPTLMKSTEPLYIMNERHNSSSAFPPKIAKTNCGGQKTMADAATWWQLVGTKTV